MDKEEFDRKLGIEKDGISPPLIKDDWGLITSTTSEGVTSINLLTTSLILFFTNYSVIEATEDWVVIRLNHNFTIVAECKFSITAFRFFEKEVINIKVRLLDRGINI